MTICEELPWHSGPDGEGDCTVCKRHLRRYMRDVVGVDLPCLRGRPDADDELPVRPAR